MIHTSTAGLRCVLHTIKATQIEVLCYRLNVFVKPILNLLEVLELSTITISERLNPIVRFVLSQSITLFD